MYHDGLERSVCDQGDQYVATWYTTPRIEPYGFPFALPFP